jgi:hypothetical protein
MILIWISFRRIWKLFHPAWISFRNSWISFRGDLDFVHRAGAGLSNAKAA